MYFCFEHNRSDKGREGKGKENREAFLTGCELDQESTLIWLKNEMA
jgi:hypothetical protein